MKFLPFAIILISIPRLQAFSAIQIQAGVDWWTPLLVFLGLLLIVAVALIVNARQSTAEMVSSHIGIEDEAHTEIATALPHETPGLPPDLVTEPAPAISEEGELFDAEKPATMVENESPSFETPSTEPFEPAPPEVPLDHSAAVVSSAILEEPVAPPGNVGDIPPIAVNPMTPAIEEEIPPEEPEDTKSPAETDTPPES